MFPKSDVSFLLFQKTNIVRFSVMTKTSPQKWWEISTHLLQRCRTVGINVRIPNSVTGKLNLKVIDALGLIWSSPFFRAILAI